MNDNGTLSAVHGRAHILLIDNRDSFTYNLAHLIASITGIMPTVIDHLDPKIRTLGNQNSDTAEGSDTLQNSGSALGANTLLNPYTHVVISPGPGNPHKTDDFGLTYQFLSATQLPVLGVCLGHQGLAVASGGRVSRIKPVHGKICQIYHDQSSLFRGIPQGFSAVRYHSLAITDLPDEFVATAHTLDGIIMAIQHKNRPWFGVQFHPESICSEYGHDLIRNFLLPDRPLASSSVTYSMPPIPAEPETVYGRSHPTSPTSAKHSILCPNPPSQALPTPQISELPWMDPATIFATCAASHKRTWWLDSNDQRSWTGQWSYLGWLLPQEISVTYDQARQLVCHYTDSPTPTHRQPCPSIFDYLRNHSISARVSEEQSSFLPMDFTGGWVGHCGYESHTLAVPKRSSSFPDACWMQVQWFYAFDHLHQKAYLVAKQDHQQLKKLYLDQQKTSTTSDTADRTATGSTKHQSDITPDYISNSPDNNEYQRYRQAFTTITDKLADGETYEVNLTYRRYKFSPTAPLPLYQQLRQANPAPYSGLLIHHQWSILLSSPERFLHLDPQRNLTTKPIKGTLPRDSNPAKDHELVRRLGSETKFQAENLMIVDLLRHDVSTVCQPGTVQVPQLMHVESYTSVHQLVSTICGKLLPEVTTIDAIEALFPPGSMTGAPKLRTMSIINDVEDTARGAYSGAFGWIGNNGQTDLAVTIRMLYGDGNGYWLGTGGGITIDSEPDTEYDETLWKSQRLLETLNHFASSATNNSAI